MSPNNNNDNNDDSEVEKLISRNNNTTGGNTTNNNNDGTSSSSSSAPPHKNNKSSSSSSIFVLLSLIKKQILQKQSITRLIVLQIILMYGCYHLGKYACTLSNENGEFSVDGAADVISKSKISKSKTTTATKSNTKSNTNTNVENEQNEQKEKSEENNDNEYALTYNKLIAMKREANNLIVMLDEYYNQHNGGPDEILLGSKGWAFGWNYNLNNLNNDVDVDVDTTSTLREEKLIDTMGYALLNTKQSKFIIGVIGSSVAAGHDNCRYDNYEEQLTRTWSTVWDVVGMTLEIQNSGQGGGCGDSHKNQVYCITQNVSPYIDIVHYVWTYFENHPGINERESLIRWTQLLDKAPPVHVINVGAFQSCLSKDKVEEDRIMEYYQEYGYNAYCMRFALRNAQHYVAKDKKKKDKYGLFENRHVGDGFHNTTRYGEKEINQLRKDSLGVVMRNWHPGPLGFQIISDAMAYTYTKALLIALRRIEESIININIDYYKSNPDEPIVSSILSDNDNNGDNTNTAAVVVVEKWMKDRKIVLGEQMKPPLVCNPKYCFVDEPPKCKNFELPTFGYYGASIAPPDDDLNPWYTDSDSNTDSNIIPQKWEPYLLDKGWDNMIDKVDASIYQDTPEFCQFPDHCAGMVGSSSIDNGRIVFKLPKMDVGMVSICFCCGKDVARQQLLENEYIEIMFNDVVLSSNRTRWDLFPERKCVRVIDDHTGLITGPSGHAYLSIRILEGNTQNVIISQIITL